MSTRFDTRELTELPVLDRNFTKFILLTPGAQQLGWQHAPVENPQGSTQTQVNGQHFSGTGYQLDGTENRDPILGIIVINPNLEFIGETKITSQNYDAEFGQATAGVVSVQTKSGSNAIHGSGFEFFQNESAAGAQPVYTGAARIRRAGKFIPDTKRNQFGGSVGGPIMASKCSSSGITRGRVARPGAGRLLTSVPTVSRERQLSASTVCGIFDPTTGLRSSRTATIPSSPVTSGARNPGS